MALEVPDLIAKIKKKHGYSETVIGLLVGVKQQTINRWLKGLNQKYSNAAVERLRLIHSGRLAPTEELDRLAKLLQERAADREFLKEVWSACEKIVKEARPDKRANARSDRESSKQHEPKKP